MASWANVLAISAEHGIGLLEKKEADPPKLAPYAASRNQPHWGGPCPTQWKTSYPERHPPGIAFHPDRDRDENRQAAHCWPETRHNGGIASIHDRVPFIAANTWHVHARDAGGRGGSVRSACACRLAHR